MSTTDYLHLNEHKIFKDLRESLPKNITKTLNLLTVHNSVLFTWDFQNACVLSLNIKGARSKEGDNVTHQKLLPLSPPLFSPELLVVNHVGTLLAVAGPCGVLVFQLPVRVPPYGAFYNNKEVVYCRSHSLDERLLCCSETVQVRQVKFHPGSAYNNHVLLLTSDNMLRFYQIKNDEVDVLSVYPVGERPTAMFPGSKTSFLDIYGEIAVDFDFGNPEVAESTVYNYSEMSGALINIDKSHRDETHLVNTQTQTVDKILPKQLSQKEQDKNERDNLVWPIYILREDMTVYSINIDLNKRSKSVLKGPLPLFSFNTEQTEACSLACLNTCPQICCIALSNGTICHSILLDIEEGSYSETKEKGKMPSKEILAFESIQLELGLSTSADDTETNYKCPIFLHKDDSKPCRYYAVHSTGVHSVEISCLEELQRFNDAPEDVEPSYDIFVKTSQTEYLICTKTASSEVVNPIIGFSLYYEPPSVLAVLSDGGLISLGIVFTSTLPRIEDLALSDNEEITSPLKKMLKEPFDKYIQNILQKASTQPVLKLSSGEHTPQQCYELLQTTAHMLREGTFKQHTKAREEIEKRVQTLVLLKKNQLKEIEIMNREREILQEKASNLAEKYEDIKDKQDDLLKKCENVLMLVCRKKAVPSDAEKKFLKELNEASELVVVFRNKLDKLKSTLKYQQIRMASWKDEEVKKVSKLNETHSLTIKMHLEETANKIAEMVAKVTEFNKLLKLK